MALGRSRPRPSTRDLARVQRLHLQWLAGDEEGRRADLSFCDLSGRYFADWNLANAKLVGARLTRADLHGANLERADLFGADLSNSDFRGAKMSRADLRGTILHDSKFDGADLNGINMRTFGEPTANNFLLTVVQLNPDPVTP